MGGMWNAMSDSMAKLLTPWGIPIQVTSLEDMTVENVILRVKKYVVVDGKDDDMKDVNMKLVKEFKDALEEETKKNQKKRKVLKADMPAAEQSGPASTRSIRE